ncbi:MAG TPA: hypothetical protein VLM79_06150, partial [Kofleriaceae bacterium]|nr:hypothetical protein [Kofleriaceae bacterium]
LYGVGQVVERMIEAFATAMEDAERHAAGLKRLCDRVEAVLQIIETELVEGALDDVSDGVSELLEQRLQATLEEAKDLREVLAQELDGIQAERLGHVGDGVQGVEIQTVPLRRICLDAERMTGAARGGIGGHVGLGLDPDGAIGRAQRTWTAMVTGIGDAGLCDVDYLVQEDFARPRILSGRLGRESDRRSACLAESPRHAEVGVALDPDLADSDAGGVLDGGASGLVEGRDARLVGAARWALMAVGVGHQCGHALRGVLPVGPERPARDADRRAVLDGEPIDIDGVDRHTGASQQLAYRGDLGGLGCALGGRIDVGDCRRLGLGSDVLGETGSTAVARCMGRLVCEEPVTVGGAGAIRAVGEYELVGDRECAGPELGGSGMRRRTGVDADIGQIGMDHGLEAPPYVGRERRTAGADRSGDQLSGAREAISVEPLRADGVAVERLAQRSGARPAPRRRLNLYL